MREVITPRWMWQAAGRYRLTELLDYGVRTLTEAVLRSGAAQAVHGADGRRTMLISGRGHEHGFSRLLVRARGSRDLAESSPEEVADEIAAMLGQKINGQYLVCGQLRRIIDDVVEAYDQGELHARRTRAVMPSEILRAEEDPFSLMKVVHRTLLHMSREPSLERVDAEALILLGLGAHALKYMQVCKLCFRWAAAGRNCCPEHCIVGKAGSDKRKASQRRYSEAMKTLSRYEWRMYRRSLPERFGQLSSDEIPFVVARVLWNCPVPNMSVRQSDLREKIFRYPNVLSELQLTDRCNVPRDTLEFLRTSLDRFEYRPGVWPSKLRAAQAWFESRTVACPVTRGAGKRAWARRRQADRLAREYGLGVSKIALEMNLAASTISRYKSAGRAISDVESRPISTEDEKRVYQRSEDNLLPTAFRE